MADVFEFPERDIELLPGPFTVPTKEWIDLANVCIDPTISSVEALDSSGTRWRAHFAEPLIDSPALRLAGLWEITGPNGHAPSVLSVTPQAGGTPAYADLVTEEHRGGADYTVTLHRLEIA